MQHYTVQPAIQSYLRGTEVLYICLLYQDTGWGKYTHHTLLRRYIAWLQVRSGQKEKQGNCDTLNLLIIDIFRKMPLTLTLLSSVTTTLLRSFLRGLAPTQCLRRNAHEVAQVRRWSHCNKQTNKGAATNKPTNAH